MVPSLIEAGLTVSVTPVGAASASVMVREVLLTVTLPSPESYLPRLGVVPEMVTVSSSSSRLSSVGLRVNCPVALLLPRGMVMVKS